MSVEQVAPVIDLGRGAAGAPRTASGRGAKAIVLLLAATLACSPLAFGYYDFTAWAPLGIGAVVLLVMLAFASAPSLGRYGRCVALGLGLLVILSFASMLWAQSRDSAWTSANQIAVYAVVFVIGLLAIRERRTARSAMFVLGLPALLSAAVLMVEFITGSGANDFLQGRLQNPMGYINGTAGLFVMGIWPWFGLAETLKSWWLRGAAVAAATLIAATAVLTQSRAIVLATVVATLLVLIAAPGRTRRGINLLIVLVAVAATAHWTLHVYSSTGPAQVLALSSSAIRAAGLALLGATLIGFALKLVVSALGRRLPMARRERLSSALGRTLLAITVLAVLSFGVAEHRRVSAQWHDFTTMKAEKSAGNRFLAIGGGYRYDLWRIALDEFAAAPVGGVGAGNYADQYYQRRRQLEDLTVPHSLELQMLAELGVGGAVGLVLSLGGVLAAGLTRRRPTLAAGDPALRIAALGMFSAWLAATSVDWLYEIPGLAGMAMLAAAVLVVPAAVPPDNAAPAARALPRDRRTQLTMIAGLAVLAMLAASLGRQYVARLYSNAGKDLVAQHPLGALRTLRTAEQLDPWAMQTQYAVASAYAQLNAYPQARAALQHAAQLEPGNYVPPALLGDIATRAGRPADALAAYRRALRLDPLEPALQAAVAAARRALG